MFACPENPFYVYKHNELSGPEERRFVQYRLAYIVSVGAIIYYYIPTSNGAEDNITVDSEMYNDYVEKRWGHGQECQLNKDYPSYWNF